MRVFVLPMGEFAISSAVRNPGFQSARYVGVTSL